MTNSSNAYAVVFSTFERTSGNAQPFARATADYRDVEVGFEIVAQFGEQLPGRFYIGPVGAIDE